MNQKEKNERRIKNWVDGSYTVEMSLILPLILIIIFLIIYMIFYEHDNVKGQAALYEHIRWKEQASLTDRYWGNLEESRRKKQEEDAIYKKGFFLLKCKSYKSDNYLFFVKESISMSGTCSIPYLEHSLKKLGMNYENKIVIPFYNPSEVLRVYDGISGYFDSEKSWDYERKHMKKIEKVFKD